MASSQPATSSPARSAAASPATRFELSPQSRLRKLLATVDSDSDDDKTPKQKASSRILQSARRQSSPSPADQVQHEPFEDADGARERVRKLLQKDATEDADVAAGDEESDDEIVRPRGRMAARMQGGEDSTIKESSTGESQDVEMGEDGDEDEDDEIPVRARRLKSKGERATAPDSAPGTPQREASPGLFVTPSKPSPSTRGGSPAADLESDHELPDIKSDRFKALVGKKRNERLAREAEEARKKEARAAAALQELGDDNDDDVSDISDDEGGRKLTQRQQPRPSRKASKKALEEMNRETQRMQREMQLAHEAKTKKKISKNSLFERFNFRPSGTSMPSKDNSGQLQTPPSSKSTDAEMQDVGTPPSSPPALVEDVLGKSQEVAPSHAATSAPDHSKTSNVLVDDEDGESLDIIDMRAFARKPTDKGKEEATPAEGQAPPAAKVVPKRRLRVKFSPVQASQVSLGSDDEGELIVVNKKKSKLDALFDRIPTTKSAECKSLRLQRQLAHIDSPERQAHKKIDKFAMTPAELQAQLAQRAREQAKLERERRLQELTAKGIHIETEEERERWREQQEDIVARARREVEEIMQREREEAKKEKRAGGDDPLAWDDSDESGDDDYREENEEAAAEDKSDAGMELSGSEDEENEDNEEEDAGMVVDGNDSDIELPAETEANHPTEFPSAQKPLIDDAADEDSGSDENSESEHSWVDPDAEDERHRWGNSSEMGIEDTPAFVQAMRPKAPIDFEGKATPRPVKSRSLNFTPKPNSTRPVNHTPAAHKHTSPDAPSSVLRSAAKTFIPGLPVDAGDPAGLGLTQIFAGTMDDSQAGPLPSPSQPMPTFDAFPNHQSSPPIQIESLNATVMDSQTIPATQADMQSSGSAQIRPNFPPSQADFASQGSQIVPTQDAGFKDWTPLKQRFVEAPASTIATVINSTSPGEDMSHESPLMQKRGRLRRKVVIASDSEDEATQDGSGSSPTAFNLMKDAAAKERRRKQQEAFDRKKSKAREMVHEQAEESEDEYAGLGGVDGEDSDDDDLASVQDMIDDKTQGNEREERKIAALHLERERAEDAKQTDKLFNDITRGMLRRKRGADYDLSDSDDGGEARRRMKRRQFAKMQKTLYADERISKVAENPRSKAFMRTIEDVGSDEEMEFLFEPQPQQQHEHEQHEPSSATHVSNTTAGNASQEQEQQHVVPDSQPAAVTATSAQQQQQRPAASERRTRISRKPVNLNEVRRTLSSLLDDPSENSVIPSTDFGSENDEDENDEDIDAGGGGEKVHSPSANKENSKPRRRRQRVSAGAVVDRISLKRQSSSNVSANNGASGGKMAFAAPSSSASNGGFRVPALLRKATTNSFMSTGSASGAGVGGSSKGGAAGGSGSGFGDEGKIKKNAGKRSGISYLARETDRRAKLAEAERKREEKKIKAVEGRSKVVGGLFGAGRFE